MNIGRTGDTTPWSWTFWLGEVVVMTLFALNTLNQSESPIKPSLLLGVGAFVLFGIVCLWIRGKFWRYALLLGMEMGLALIAVIVFPIIEMVLEELMNEKLRKVGEKVRLYGKTIEEIYRVRLEEAASLRSSSDDGVKTRSNTTTTSGGAGVRLRHANSPVGQID